MLIFREAFVCCGLTTKDRVWFGLSVHMAKDSDDGVLGVLTVPPGSDRYSAVWKTKADLLCECLGYQIIRQTMASASAMLCCVFHTCVPFHMIA